MADDCPKCKVLSRALFRSINVLRSAPRGTDLFLERPGFHHAIVADSLYRSVVEQATRAMDGKG
jgi:hypothetical protein